MLARKDSATTEMLVHDLELFLNFIADLELNITASGIFQKKT